MTKDTQDTSEKKLSIKNPGILLATWFGAGFMRPAPGTWGSLAALPFGIIIFQLGGFIALTIGIFASYIIGVWAAKKFEDATGEHDSKMIVIDEVCGQWIALIPAFILAGVDPVYTLAAFLLFRFFDITKPYPANYCDQNIQNAHGVMLDDVVAGIYAGLFLYGGHIALIASGLL